MNKWMRIIILALTTLLIVIYLVQRSTPHDTKSLEFNETAPQIYDTNKTIEIIQSLPLASDVSPKE